MKIKRLEMGGFKSFVDRTVVDFPEGITAVVGPNGCGKSNIVDAIRWVLGEQSYKNLRGKTMEDVIFNGSEGRSPTGMAEVIFTLDNRDGGIGGHFSSYSEISIGRRLFRSGESEYLLNRAPARLKDIQDIFLDTGVGSKAHYSIIEQGKVGLVLSAKPEERRILIEEAAGISKFRLRKEAALRKMESTKQNLLRVTDVVVEVKRQIEYTRRQAQKARRYLELEGDVRRLEATLWRVDYRAIKGALDRAQTECEQVGQQETGVRAVMAGLESQIEQGRLESVEHENTIRQVQEGVFQAQSRIQVLERDQEHAKKMLLDLQEEQKNAGPQITQARDGVAIQRGLLEDAKRKTLEIGREEENHNQELAGAESELNGLDENLAQSERQIETLRDGIHSLVSRMTSFGGLLEHLDQSRIDLSKRLAGTEIEEHELEKRLLQLGQGLRKEETKLEGLKQLQLELRTKSDEGRQSLEGLAQEKTKVENEIFQVRERLATFKSRLHVLQELQANYEGLHEGVRSIMLRQKGDDASHRGILGLVADLITLPKEYERAAEAALGDRLQYVVVRNQQTGVEAIDYLNAQAAGRSTFIPLHIREWAETSGKAAVQGEGVIGSMLSLVQSNPDYQEVLRYLFGDVVVVNTLDNALRVWQENGHHQTLVTLNGEVVDPHGVVSGGRRSRSPAQEAPEAMPDASSLLQRKRFLGDLEQQILATEEQLRNLEGRQQELTRTLSFSKAHVETLQRDQHEEELKFVRQQKEMTQVREECQRCETLLLKVRERKAKEAKSLTAIEAQSREAADSIATAKLQKEQMTKDLEEQKEISLGFRSRLQTLKDRVIDLKVRIAELREQKGHAQSEVVRLEQEIKDRSEQIERLQERFERGGLEMRALIEGQTARESEIQDQIRKLRVLEEDLKRERQGFQQKANDLDAHGETLREKRRVLESLSQFISQMRVEIAQLQMKLSALEAEAKTFGGTLEALKEEALGATPVDLKPEEIDQIRQDLGTLRQQMENLGTVNLAAVNELEDLSQRHIFLTRQTEDLTHSMEALQKTIYKVERTSRERFRATFDAVNGKFQEIFPRLFGGGKASLILTDENDLLATGVDLLCQPPGKKIQNVTLLSGGEKALASICLILAIFLIKPSPFCLLDEVDAPLDDANISRFNDLLRELARESQLILITHNRHTMEIADYLYGVTMEEPGVSRMVSVRMS